MRLTKYFISQLFNNKSFTWLFILNLAFGLSSFVTLDIFKNSIDSSLKKRSKVLLGADFGISARRPITDAESNLITSLESSTQTTNMIEVFSMVAGPTGKSKLVQIKAIDPQFPFYGHIKLSDQSLSKATGASVSLNQQKIAWVYPELISQLDVKINQNIKIGKTDFTVKAIVEQDNAEGISTSMAPRLYIGLKYLGSTDLINFGSVAWYSQLYKFSNNNYKNLDLYKKEIDDSNLATDLKVYTHANVSEQTGRILKYLNDFLGLVSVAALFLAAIGGAFLFRSFLSKQLHSFGIYMSLGMSLKEILYNQAIQLFVLGIAGSILALLFGFILSPLLKYTTSGLLPFEIITHIEPTTILLILILGSLGSLLIGLPLISQLINIKPKKLFSSKSNQILKKNMWSWLALVPGLLFLWGLSIWQSNSLKIGSLFTITFILAGVLISVFSLIMLKIFSSFKNISNLSLKWSLRDLARHPVASISIFLSMGLGTLLLNLIPQIKASINYELSMPKDSKLPSFFVFDIQNDQLETMHNISNIYNVDLNQTSPMVRARLKKINETSFEKFQLKGKNLNREQQRQQQARNRGYNLSYRQGLGIGESLYKGRLFSGSYKAEDGKLAEISVEKRFAERLKIKIGDVLTFDIQGVEVKGSIINLRKVRWTTFQPNFFILFQPGVLEDAPKTYLSSVPKLDSSIKQKFQDSIVSQLPNVSVVDVSRLVKRLQGIIVQMSWALQFMTIICLIAGFLVLFSIANYQARQRSSDIALLKSLGTPFSTIKNYFLWQFTLLSLFSGLFGIGLCFVMSYFMSSLLFDSRWILDWKMPLATLFLLVVITLIITNFATSQFLRIKPAKLLGND